MWEYHREQAERQPNEEDSKAKEAMEALSLAIAKVQFVQVYLEDASLPLPIEEHTDKVSATKAAASLASPEPEPAKPLSSMESEQSVSATQSSPLATTTTKQPPVSPARQTTPPPPTQSISSLSPRSRPHLTSSNFSWMLGEDSASSTFATGTAHSTFSSDEKRRMKGKGFLFGDSDEDEGTPKERRRSSVSSKGPSKGGKNANRKHVPEVLVDEETIDLDNMGSRGVL
jgi:TBC1 domain family member 5